MTHIGLSVSHGGVGNDAPARESLFEATCWKGSQSSQILGRNELNPSLCQFFFCLKCGMWKSGTLHLPFLSIRKLYWPVDLSVCGCKPIKFVPCSQKPRCRNSPGSCCPQESRWCCCWGWTTRLVLLSYGEPLRSLTWSRQVRKRDPGLLKWWSKSTDKTSCKVRWDWLKPTWALGESGVSCGTKCESLPFNHAAQGLWTLNSALSRSSIVRWERSNKWDSSSEGREES